MFMLRESMVLILPFVIIKIIMNNNNNIFIIISITTQVNQVGKEITCLDRIIIMMTMMITMALSTEIILTIATTIIIIIIVVINKIKSEFMVKSLLILLRFTSPISM